MSATPGWYPDPGGQPGLFRYWDGRSWSPTTTTTPYAGPPVGPTAYGSGPSQPSGYGASAGRGPSYGGGGTAGAATGAPRTAGVPTGLAPRRRPVGWILALVGVVVVLAVIVGVAVWALRGGGNPIADPDPQTDPTGISCPKISSASASPIPDPGGDRVVSGRLSYPRLGSPFSAPQPDSRTPFGRDVRSQTAEVEQSSDGKTTWVAAVLIARLLAGDGFYGPQQGAAVVAECVIGTFYGDNPVQREDERNEATTIDGHDAWIIDMHLTFDIPGIETKGEQATIVVIDTGQTDGEAGLYYSSIPDTSPQFTQPAAAALKGLRVS